MKTFFILLLVVILCGCAETREQIEADIWTVKSETGSIGRTVTDESGVSYREAVKCTHKGATVFICMHKDDVKKWTELLTRECGEK